MGIAALLAPGWAGAEVITVVSGQTVYGAVLGTPQADQITVEAGGVVQDFLSGEGSDDYIVNNGTVGWYMVGFELGEGGSPTVINNGLIEEDLVGTAGGSDPSNQVLVENQGEVQGMMIGSFASDGHFTVKNNGTVHGDLYGTSGDCFCSQPGQGYKAEVYNTGTVYGAIFGAFLDNGNVYIENSGTVMQDIYGSILGTGYAVIVNSGTVLGGILGGFGDDQITLVGGGTVGLMVDGFEGNDTLILDNMGPQDGSLWGDKYAEFENLSFTGQDNQLTGAWQLSGVPVTVYDGSFTLQAGASLHAQSLDVQSGGQASLLGSAQFDAAVTVSGILSTQGAFTAASLSIDGGGQASLYGDSTISGQVMLAGSLLVAGQLGAAQVQSSGLLTVNGTLTSPQVDITSSGSLFGTGVIIGNLTNNGSLNPGNSVGLLTIQGDYTQNPGASLVSEAQADGSADLLHVTGRAQLNGGTLITPVQEALYPNGFSWTVLRADGGVSGSFDSVEEMVYSAVLDFAVRTTDNSVELEVLRKPYSDFARNPNDAALAGALDRVLLDSSGELRNMLMAMDWTMDQGQISRALDELSPEMYTAFEPASFELGLVFQRVMAYRLEQVRHGKLLGGQIQKAEAGQVRLAALGSGLPLQSAPTSGPGLAFWGRALGSWSGRNSSQDYLGWSQSLGGAVAGVDALLNDRFRAGLALGGAKSDLGWSKEGLGGDLEALHAGLYAQACLGRSYLRGSVSYASLDSSAQREIDYPGFSATAKGSFSGDLLGAELEYGQELLWLAWLVEPSAGLSYQHLSQGGFDESGAGTLGLKVKGIESDSLLSRLGLSLSRLFRAGAWELTPRLGLFWLHRFQDDRPSLEASFPDDTPNAFTVRGAGLPQDSALLQAGIQAGLSRSFSLFADYSLRQGREYQAQTLSAGVRLSF